MGRGNSGSVGRPTDRPRRCSSGRARLGAIGVIVVGFTWGGWVTGGTARSMAQNAAVSAHDELVAVICVERFQNGRDAHGQLAALKELQGWNRGRVHREGRLGDDARQGHADRHGRAALRRPAHGAVTAAGDTLPQDETAGVWPGELG